MIVPCKGGLDLEIWLLYFVSLGGWHEDFAHPHIQTKSQGLREDYVFVPHMFTAVTVCGILLG